MPQQAELSVETKRLSAHEILDAVLNEARDEVRRSPGALAFSGLAGGLTAGLTGLAVASIRAVGGSTPIMELVSLLAYPTGFIAVIIARQQLFTENTLYPVVLVLDERKYLGATARLWVIVFACNILGALLFALIAVQCGAVGPEISRELARLGQQSVNGAPAHLFWSGIMGGWLIALVAWIVSASQWTIGQVVMVWLLTFVVGVGHFAHCIATSGEILCAVFAGSASLGGYFHWLMPSTLGNIVGGVVIVSLLNYGQVRQD